MHIFIVDIAQLKKICLMLIARLNRLTKYFHCNMYTKRYLFMMNFINVMMLQKIIRITVCLCFNMLSEQCSIGNIQILLMRKPKRIPSQYDLRKFGILESF